MRTWLVTVGEPLPVDPGHPPHRERRKRLDRVHPAESKDAAKKRITGTLGWRDYGGKHYESFFTRFFQAYYLPMKFGYDKRKAHLSSLIVTRQLAPYPSNAWLAAPKDRPIDRFRRRRTVWQRPFREVSRMPKQQDYLVGNMSSFLVGSIAEACVTYFAGLR